MNYRMGRHHQTTNQVIVSVEGYDDKEKAEKLLGKNVSYSCDGKAGKVLRGRVSSPHGNSGAIRVLFEKGLPGQAIGSKVSIQ